jgi:hypothetical protein
MGVSIQLNNGEWAYYSKKNPTPTIPPKLLAFIAIVLLRVTLCYCILLLPIGHSPTNLKCRVYYEFTQVDQNSCQPLIPEAWRTVLKSTISELGPPHRDWVNLSYSKFGCHADHD